MVKLNMLQVHILLRLKDTDIITNPLFLVLRNALGYPRDVADFLSTVSYNVHASSRKKDLPVLGV